MNIKLFRKIFFIIWAILMTIGIIIGAVSDSQRKSGNSYLNTRVVNFSVCQDANGNLLITDGYVEICGDIITDNPPVALALILHKTPENEFIDQNPVSDKFDAGYFSRRLKLPEYNRAGTYRVDVYLYRDIIAFVEFDIEQ